MTLKVILFYLVILNKGRLKLTSLQGRRPPTLTYLAVSFRGEKGKGDTAKFIRLFAGCLNPKC